MLNYLYLKKKKKKRVKCHKNCPVLLHKLQFPV